MAALTDALLFIGLTARDVLPIAVFLFAFQQLVIREPMPHRGQVAAGFLFVVVGLGLFLVGLDKALFPLGALMAEQLTDPDFLHAATGKVGVLSWQDYYWVFLFAAAIGFSTAMAEPALVAVAIKANQVSGGAIHVWGLRVAVAIGVGVGVSLGCFRIIAGIPLHYFIVTCYVVVMIQTALAPKVIVPLAFDSGGVTTSTVTVPLIAALGIGVADAVPGRSPILDGFGLVASAALFPIVSVLAYGQLAELIGREGKSQPERQES